jgi:methionyl aminopeptidase
MVFAKRNKRPEGIYLKSDAEIARIRRAGRILHAVLKEVAAAAQPGVTTLELDRLARTRIREAKARPAFLGQYGFPATLCISINEQVVHGIPSKRRLQEGDIVSIDCGVVFDGFFSDSAVTVPVGRVSEEAQRLMDVTRESLDRAIAQCLPGNRTGDIGWAVESFVTQHGYSVVEGYGGHGVGRKIHEDPKVDNVGPAGTGERLRRGLVIAVEPMVNIGSGETEELDDEWTVVTKDGSLSAHYEHTVAITADGYEILTIGED